MISNIKYIGIFCLSLVGLFLYLYWTDDRRVYTEEAAKKYLPGSYLYESPSGELRILKINSDFTFEQTIISKNKKDTLCENNGFIEVDNAEITFQHWLQYFDVLDQKVLHEPRITSWGGPFWRKPKGQRNVLIIMYDEPYYIFEKITSD